MLFSLRARRLAAVVSLFALSACGGGACASCNAPPIYTPSPAPGGAATPTPLPGATATPTPHATPTATPTPVPTATPVVALSCAQNAVSGGAVPLGSDATVALLAGSAITNTGVTMITGNVDISPGTAYTDAGTATIVDGSLNVGAGNPEAQAQLDLTTAYNYARTRPNPQLIGPDITGLTVAPGVYNASAALAINGNVTLDGQNNPNSVFIFQITSSLITSTGSTVTLINRANACNVFWQVGSSATLGGTSVFNGVILANTAITFDGGATMTGRALASTGAVTLINDVVTQPAP